MALEVDVVGSAEQIGEIDEVLDLISIGIKEIKTYMAYLLSFIGWLSHQSSPPYLSLSLSIFLGVLVV